MHVLVTADTVGGVWTYTRELVAGLLRRGRRVTLVSFGRFPSAAQTRWVEELAARHAGRLDYRPTPFRLEWMQEAEADIAASRDYLQGVVEETRPDLLHLSQFCYGDLPGDVPRLVVAHSDVVSWWRAVRGDEPPSSPWLDWYRDVVARGVAGADAVVAPSAWMLEQVVEHHGRPECGVVIYNGRSPQLFIPHLSKENYVASVGRVWDEGKNTRLLLDAAPDVPVRIAGPARSPEREGDAEAEISSRPNVTFLGETNEIALRQLYARAAVYAATSLYEPFGLAPVEAALSRCALVLSDIPSFRELWGDAAWYVRPNDPADLREALERMVHDARLRARHGLMAMDRARERFGAERMVDEYVQLHRIIACTRATAA